MAKIIIQQTNKPEVPDTPVSDISIDGLIDNGLLALYREMKNLLMASSKGKLDSASSRDLRDIIKLLFELKDRENQILSGLSDEEFDAKVQQALSKPDGNN